MSISIIRKSKSLLKYLLVASSSMGMAIQTANVEVTLESTIKIADNALHFDGKKVDASTPDNNTEKYDYFYGPTISAHGDSIKTYKHYIFTTWYRGGKYDRHVMLTRYNTLTDSKATIEFPHRHTGFSGKTHIGESHNTIAVAVSPINGTIHLLYDMHSYRDQGAFKNDFFRYSYSVPGAAEVSDSNFNLSQFVKDTSTISQGPDDYKHVTMTGDLADVLDDTRLTYPKFFTNSDGVLLSYMRNGRDNNGRYVFNRYDAVNQKWSKYTAFNSLNALDKGNDYNWGLYGNMKYVAGKLRVGFQQRTDIKDDRYTHQNGVFYAYSDHPEGFGDWKNHKGESITWPLVNSDEIKVFEPADFITGHEDPNSVHMVTYFDWTVTERGDIHIISRVRSADSKRADFQKVHIHSYKPFGSTEFIHSTEFAGARSLYTSGNDVYVIGLNASGRPFVEKTEGGMSNFTRVYDGDSGIRFSHGVPYISQGKLYYYLMERAEGAARPVHVQIIDLGIEKASVSFESENINVLSDYQNLEITAKPIVNHSSLTIKYVTLYLNDELVSTIHNPPYKWTAAEAKLQNLAVASYQLKAVATDSNDATAPTLTKLNVIDPTPSVSFSTSVQTLTEGYKNLNLTLNAATPVAERTIAKVTLFINEQEVSAKTTAPYVWSEADALLKALTVGTHTIEAVVTDNKGLSATTSQSIIIEADTTPPSVSFNQSSVIKTKGYTSISIGANASTTNVSASIDNIALYLNGALISKERKSSHVWTEEKVQLVNLPAGNHALKVIVTDSKGLTSEANITLTVNQQATNKPDENTGGNQSSGGGSTNIIILFILTLFTLCRKFRP